MHVVCVRIPKMDMSSAASVGSHDTADVVCPYQEGPVVRVYMQFDEHFGLLAPQRSDSIPEENKVPSRLEGWLRWHGPRL